jgi:hypothetical protein
MVTATAAIITIGPFTSALFMSLFGPIMTCRFAEQWIKIFTASLARCHPQRPQQLEYPLNELSVSVDIAWYVVYNYAWSVLAS